MVYQTYLNKKVMNYTAKQIDNMSIEAIEELANTLTEKELSKWCGSGYSGKCYIEIIKSR